MAKKGWLTPERQGIVKNLKDAAEMVGIMEEDGDLDEDAYNELGIDSEFNFEIVAGNIIKLLHGKRIYQGRLSLLLSQIAHDFKTPGR